MKTKRKCSGTKGYACGKSCISVKFICRKEMSGQSVDIANRLMDLVKAATVASKVPTKDDSKPTYTSPIANSPQRAAARKRIIDTYFLGKEELVKKYETAITDLIKGQSVKVAIYSQLAEKIRSEDGLLKNQHEVKDSTGDYNPGLRTDVERDRFGYDGKNLSDNPKYGFLMTDENYYSVETYGDEIYQNTKMPYEKYTVTVGDSLYDEIYGSRANDFKIESMSEDSIKMMLTEEGTPRNFDDLHAMYVEVQMGGKVDFNEFEKIR